MDRTHLLPALAALVIASALWTARSPALAANGPPGSTGLKDFKVLYRNSASAGQNHRCFVRLAPDVAAGRPPGSRLNRRK